MLKDNLKVFKNCLKACESCVKPFLIKLKAIKHNLNDFPTMLNALKAFVGKCFSYTRYMVLNTFTMLYKPPPGVESIQRFLFENPFLNTRNLRNKQ